jgi:hypothetical protein
MEKRAFTNRGYDEAIKALNNLQTNSEVLDAVLVTIFLHNISMSQL